MRFENTSTTAHHTHRAATSAPSASNARLGFVTFNDHAAICAVPVDPYQGWLQQRIESLPGRVGGSTTNITDGLRKSVEMLSHPSVAPHAIKEIWLLSDGDANVELAGLPGAVASAIAIGARVHAIAFGDQADIVGLRRIAEATGGQLVSVRDLEGLTAALVGLANDSASRGARRKRVTVFAIDTSPSMRGPAGSVRKIDAVVRAALHLTRNQQLAYA